MRQFPGNWANSSLVIRKSGVNALRFHVKLCNTDILHLWQQPAGQQPAGQQPAGQQPAGQQPAGDKSPAS
ncbi:hypothetical protein [Laspinema olomoucense]|uniref:Uncharacterized protein n=1 Tax=Laspinema olomoucense D3b TaxID=2953688 RepID=A0ABT2N4M0_9CYAN|nr:hypothetical protein [Laspinema sp. D3b]MCT7976340.1 hypothetical protein [Laspinema sp. D3b]